jgi:GNAT superfamily N-acetyltransferase
MQHNYALLDDPFWSALQTVQRPFAMGNSHIKKFRADVLPFVGLERYEENLMHEIEPFVERNEAIFVKDAFPSFPPNWHILNRLPVIQMICTKPFEIGMHDAEIVPLGEDDYRQLFELVSLVQPGYFKQQTHLLGKYYGIKKQGILVAVAGERLKIDGFIEVSAVCTLPGHTGKGYAQQLMALLCKQIFETGNIPFLHVLETNARAVKLYGFLNFTKRMDFPLIKAMVAGYQTG